MIRHLLAAATFALALSPAALAQDAPKFSTKTTKISDILANPEAKAAFGKVMPQVVAAPELAQAYEMTIDEVKAVAPDYFPEEKVKELDVELSKIK